MELGTLNSDFKDVAKETRFNPYAMHGGSCLAIAGDDFSVIASDTRLSEGFSILSRDSPKTYKLTDTTVVGCTGFHGDVLTLTKSIRARLTMYEQEHGKKMKASAIAAMLSTMLYQRRFFPYYVSNIIAGIDDEGKGCVYSFDPVGSYERETYRAGGSGSSMLTPLLDSQIGHKNQREAAAPLTLEKAIVVARDVFISAAERDIYTGDAIQLQVITKDGIKQDTFPLRRD
ncbi:proteasome subunit beta type-1-like [Watersipora subatra]|uniref:proteasome subunit beta type-1-like n=1 Tax=Watersipora subatra TaxID=2589382 RepID=UPI00355B7829